MMSVTTRNTWRARSRNVAVHRILIRPCVPTLTLEVDAERGAQVGCAHRGADRAATTGAPAIRKNKLLFQQCPTRRILLS